MAAPSPRLYGGLSNNPGMPRRARVSCRIAVPSRSAPPWFPARLNGRCSVVMIHGVWKVWLCSEQEVKNNPAKAAQTATGLSQDVKLYFGKRRGRGTGEVGLVVRPC